MADNEPTFDWASAQVNDVIDEGDYELVEYVDANGQRAFKVHTFTVDHWETPDGETLVPPEDASFQQPEVTLERSTLVELLDEVMALAGTLEEYDWSVEHVTTLVDDVVDEAGLTEEDD